MEQKSNPKASNKQAICVSIFKNGRTTTSTKEYTKIWTELINRLEKGKVINLCEL